MANIKVKRSAVPGKIPQVGDLQLGEFALNTYDGKLFAKKNVNGVESIVEFGQTTAGVITFNTRSGAVTLNSSDVTGALGYTPYNSTNPSGYITSSALTPYITSATAASTYQPLDADLTSIAGLAGTSGLLKKTATNTWSLDTNTYLTGNQSISISGDATGSGTTAIALTLANSGVAAGTYTKVTVDAKGRATSGTTLSASDIPSLDASKITSGVLDAARLPSYVDDVLEYTNLAAFPATGETGKIYVALDTNKTYRWSGSSYVYITSGAVDSVAGKTGVVTLVSSDVGLGNVENKSSATIRGELTSGNVTTALGYTPYNSTNPSGYITSAALSSYLPLSGGTLTGSNTPSTPILAINVSGSGAFQRGVRMLNSGMAAGDSLMYAVGNADSSKNMGQFYFYYSAAGSNSNRLSAGLHSVDDVFNIFGSGNVMIGTTTDSGHKFNVSGTMNSTGALTQAGNQVLHAGNYSNYSPRSRSTEMSASVAGAGWYKVAKATSGAGRGGFEVFVYTTGGSYSPQQLRVSGFRDWSGYGWINSAEVSGTSYFTGVRVTSDGTDAWVEVYFTGAIASFYLWTRSYGFDTFAPLSGALTAGSGTVYQTLSLVEGFNAAQASVNANAVLHAGNYNSYALPLSGGTLTGAVTLNTGTANGVAYLNGSKVLTTGSALTFDGTNLGVGVASGTAPIDVASASSTVGIYVRGRSSDNIGSVYFTANGSTGTEYGYIQGRSTDLRIFTPNSNPLLFGISGSEQMRLTSTGLGIGTSSPSNKLTVAGNIEVTGTGYFYSSGRFGGANNGAIIFQNGTGANGGLAEIATSTWGLGYWASTPSAGALIPYITWSTSADAIKFRTANTDRMTLDSSGNLGLGVTPSAYGGNVKAIEVNNGTNIYGYSDGTTFISGVGNNVVGAGATNRYKNTAAASEYVQNAGAHKWYTAPSGTAGNAISFTQAMTLTAAGNRGLGTSSPTALTGYVAETINGTSGSFTEYQQNGSNTFRVGSDASDGGFLFTQGATAIRFGTNGTERARISSTGTFNVVGAITQNGNQVLHAGNYSSYALPLSGGTVTGNLYVNSEIRLNAANTARIAWRPAGSGTLALGFPFALNPATGAINIEASDGDTGGLMIDNEGVTVYGAGDTGYVFRVIDEDQYQTNGNSVANATQFWVGQDSGASGFRNQLTIAGNTALHAGNYTSYSPSLTGSGASGTWGISVTGSAGSVAWTNVTSRPTAVSSFTNDSGYITSSGSISGSAGSVSGLTLTSSANGINPDNVTQNQLGYNTSVSLFGQSDGGLYSSAYSSSWIHQIYGDFRTGQIAIRGKNSGTWQSWRTVLDSSNYSSYALPLSGGTLTGNLSIDTANGEILVTPTGWRSTDRAAIKIRSKADTPAEIDLRHTVSGVESGWHISARGAAGDASELHFYRFNMTAAGAADAAGSFVQMFAFKANGSFNTVGAITQNGSQVLHAGNYTSYSPSLTGSGASGTWSISVTGNAATATALQTARTINGVSFNGSANITVADSTKLPLAGGTMTGAITFAAGQTWPTFNQNTTGSAATLTTARTINGTSFNGSANITTANWGTARTITVGSTGKSVDGSANVSWTLAEITGTTAAPQFGSLGVGTAASGTAGEIRADANITAYYSSDIKFKENVHEISNAASIVCAIGGKYFDWNDQYIADHGGADGYFIQKQDFGVIAQDVLQVFPRAVRQRADGSLAVDYEKLSALAFAAIREQDARIARLESIISKLIGD